MTIAAGTKLGRYEIRSKIGEGGMGQVYLACDTKLNRDVAIKVLPAAVEENSERLRRFEQEAQAASALNHPNILIVYDVGTHEGAPYGRRAFHGESAADTMSAILKEDPPDLSETNQNISPALERLVNHCLEKNPEARFHSASDLAFALEAVSGSSGASQQTITAMTALSPRERIKKYSPWIVAGVFALAFLVTIPFALLYFHRPSTPAPAAVRFLIAPPEKADYFGAPVISPDGHLVVFGVRDSSGKESLWIRSLDSLEAHSLAGTEGSESPPFWSPDSRSIGFFSAGKLKRVDVSGGPAQTLCDATFAGGTWNRDGVIILRGTGGRLVRIPATGGPPTPLTTLDKSRNEAFHAYPYFLPDDILLAARKTRRVRFSLAHSIVAHVRLEFCYERKGDYDAAIAESQRVFDLGRKSLGIAGLAQAYALAGKRNEAQKKISELQELSKERYVSPSLFALVYAALGDKDQAFAWLEKSIDEHDLVTGRIKVDHRFANLRSDPRFAELVKRVGLQP